MPEVIYIYLLVASFAWGACMGSFLNVCIWRIPAGGSIVNPPSHCPCCGIPIPWYLNVPLLSWPLLGARCRNCCTHIPARYVLLELLTALLFVLALLTFPATHGGTPPLGLASVGSLSIVLIYWIAYSGLIIATFVDLDWMIIPDRISIGGTVLGIFVSILVPELHGSTSALAGCGYAILGAGFGYGLLLIVGGIGRLMFKREAMGFGDVKLLAAIGAFFGVGGAVFSLIVGAFIGSAVGIGVMIKRGRKWGCKIPFGPYLAIGAVIWTLWGPRLVAAYLQLLQPV